jgi:GTP pyrophosphokinase
MHRIAEEGIAAHWKYKEGRKGPAADDQRIAWLRHLVEWQRDVQDPGEFMSTLKVDLYPEEVYAFTPKGKVLALPRGASPVDFAYAVHTQVGNQCIGAKVNGQIVPLRHSLSNGDVVEILTQKGHVPSRDWLNFVRTSRARSKIRHHINSIERSQATEVGKRLLEREARQSGRSLKKIPEAELLRVATEYGCAKLEDLFADLGYGKYSPRQIISKALGEPLAPAKPEGAKEDSPARLVSTVRRMLGVGDATLQVGGQSDLMVFRAKCCNPIPGDEIIGYVTRGRGVAVHSNSCPNVQNLLYQPERRIDVEWSGTTGALYPVTLLIRAQDRPGMLADITTVISETGSNIRTLGSHPDNLHARIDLTLEISDRKQLERIIANIRKISGIFGVERLYNV